MTCIWINGDMEMCGCATDGGNLCPAHRHEQDKLNNDGKLAVLSHAVSVTNAQIEKLMDARTGGDVFYEMLCNSMIELLENQLMVMQIMISELEEK